MFCAIGVAVMTAFVRNGMKVEPFTPAADGTCARVALKLRRYWLN